MTTAMKSRTESAPLLGSGCSVKQSMELKRAGSSYVRRVRFQDDHIDMDGSLKAAVFGFNDGLCANTCLMIGIASASSITPAVVVASGLVGLFSGAASMAAGEWVSTTLQNRAEAGEIAKEKQHLEDHPEEEDAYFFSKMRKFGFSQKTIASMAEDMRHTDDPDMRLRLHVKVELGLDIDDERGNPVKSMFFMMVSFMLGAAVPLLPWIPFWYPGPSVALMFSIILALIASTLAGVVVSQYTDETAVVTAGRQVFSAAVAILAVYSIGLLYEALGGNIQAATA